MHVQQIPLPGALPTGEEGGSGTIQSFLNVFIYSWHVLEWALRSRLPSSHGFSIALPPNSSLVAGIATEEQVIALEKLVEQQRLLQCENFKWYHT
jgi:hypothetical protein